MGLANYHDQIVEFFATIRELPTRGLNLKFGVNTEHVKTFDIDEVFGVDCSSFKTINLYLHVDTNSRKRLLSSIGKCMDRHLSPTMSS